MTSAQLLPLPPVAAVAQQLAALPEVRVWPSALINGNAFWVNGCEIAYLQGKTLSVRLPKAMFDQYRADLLADPRVELKGADGHWVSIRLRSQADADWAVDIVEASADAHLPPPGVAPLPPPTRTRKARVVSLQRWA